jgi:hypothetical protein
MSSGLVLANAFVINRLVAAAIAVGALLVLTGVAHLLVLSAESSATTPTAVQLRRRGIKALVIGADGRASTSKVQVVLWFYAVLFAFVFLLAWGRSINCDDETGSDRCEQATKARDVFDDVVDTPLQPEYFALLGLPVTAAVAAKALTSSKVMSGALTKPPLEAAAAAAPPGPATDPYTVATGGDPAPTPGGSAGNVGGVAQGLAEVVSDDRGNTDLLDFQYLGFNLLALAFFLIEFLTDPANGPRSVSPAADTAPHCSI